MAFTERYVTSAAAGGGDGSSGSPWTLAEALTNAAAGDRVNVQSDSGYSLGTDAISGTPTISQSIVFRGYNASIGDLDTIARNADGTLDTTNFPAIDLSGVLSIVNYSFLQNLNITSSTLANFLVNAGASDKCGLINCRLVNSNSAAGAKCFGGDNEVILIGSELECTATTHGIVCDIDNSAIVCGCRFLGNSTAGQTLLNNDFAAGAITRSVFRGHSSAIGINVASTVNTSMIVQGCTFYGIGTAIQLSNAAHNTPLIAIDNHVTDCGKWIDSLYSATANIGVIELNNRTRDVTTLRTGIGEWPNIGEITTDTGGHETDFENATSGDFRLISDAPGYAAALLNNLDIGALQHDDPAGGGGGGLRLVGRGGLVS